MTESREQFRKRIRGVYTGVYDQQFDVHVASHANSEGLVDIRNFEVAANDAATDAALAVYAAALRDVRDLLRHLDDEDASIFPPDVEVAKYAQRLGIALDDAP